MDTQQFFDERLKALNPTQRKAVLDALRKESDQLIERVLTKAQPEHAEAEQQRFRLELRKAFRWDEKNQAWHLDMNTAQGVLSRFEGSAISVSDLRAGRKSSSYDLNSALKGVLAKLEAEKLHPPSPEVTSPEE
jgi:hypothetical protein